MSSVKFENVTATAKANIYFDGKVISHSIETADGEKKTLGIIYPAIIILEQNLPRRWLWLRENARSK